MLSKSGRSIAIEMNALKDDNLDQIGKTVSEVVLLATNRLAANQTLSHLTLYLIEEQTIQLIPLIEIKSKQFSDKYFELLVNLRLFRKNNNSFVINRKAIENIGNVLKATNDSVKTCKQLETIELTYITGRQSDRVLEDFYYVLREEQIDSSFLSMINILCIKSTHESIPKPLTSSPKSRCTEKEAELEALIDWQTIDENENAVDGYFKVWLHDLNRDSEKIRIRMTGGQTASEELVIKCDLKEAIIDLNLIPIRNKNEINVNSSQNQSFESFSNICANNSTYDMLMVGLITRDGLCDSVIYGNPYILCATRSPNLPFNELETNSHRFHSLLDLMNEKKVIIILEMIKENEENVRSSRPNSFYALLSSPDFRTVLMKSIATKEQLLPYFNDSVDKLIQRAPSEAVRESVRQRFNCFSVSDIYNPLHISNNLYKFLAPVPSSQHYNGDQDINKSVKDFHIS